MVLAQQAVVGVSPRAMLAADVRTARRERATKEIRENMLYELLDEYESCLAEG